MRTYPQLSMHHLLYELPEVQGHALLAGAAATDPMGAGDIKGGYISQEIKRRTG